MKRWIGMMGLLAVVMFGSGCMPQAILIQRASGNRGLSETVLHKDAGWFVKDKIAIIDVDGAISNSSEPGLFSAGENPVSSFIDKLGRAGSDEHVKAIVVRLNTPGGTVSASDIMYHSLMEFKAKTKKPVIACMLGVAASGGYYLACGSDGIVAQPSTVTGSIGTIMQMFNVTGTMRMIGVTAEAIKSGDMKTVGSPFKTMTEDERAILQDIILHFYEQFLAVVEKGRPGIEVDKLRTLADGRVYTAEQALENGLIDQIGYVDDAIGWAKKKAGVGKCKVVIYHRAAGYKSNIYSRAEPQVSAGALVNVELPNWIQNRGPQFLYLWQPGMN